MADRDEADVVSLRLAHLVEDSAEDLYEHAPCGYVSALPDGTIVRVNQTFLSWTGYQAEELVGRRRLHDLLTPGGRIFYETHYAPMLRMQGSVRELAVDLVCAGGATLPVLVNSVLKYDENGEPVVSRTTVFDATERRSYERELLLAKQRAEESEARARLLAETLQRSLIPPALPPIPGLEIAAAYRPAGLGDEVGGDFYDVFETGRGEWAVVVGDVCGKGPEAAVVTALARNTIRAAAMRTRRPSRVLALLNEALLRHADRFCTVVYARVRKTGTRWQVTVASGGHPLPVLATPTTPPVPFGRHGDLMGVVGDARVHDFTIDLGPDEAVVLYTDGVTEARRRDGSFYGADRMMQLLADLPSAPAAVLAEAIENEVVAFQDGFPRDDIAVVVLRTPAADQPPGGTEPRATG